MYEEWVCSRCGMKVWRVALKSETGKATAPFPHSLELRPSDYSEPALCPGYISRTGNTSDAYVDAAKSPSQCDGDIEMDSYYQRTPANAAKAVKG